MLVRRRKALPLFLKRATEAGGGIHVPKPAHRIVALFDAAMILLDPVVQIRVAAVGHRFAQRLADRPRIGVMPIRRDPLRCLASHVQRLHKEPLRCVHIPLFTEPDVHQGTIPIDGTLQVAPRSINLDVGFIDMPGGADMPMALGTEVVSKQRRNASLPRAHGRMGACNAALEKHLG